MQAVHGRGVSLIEPWAVALCCAVLPLPSVAADDPAPQIARAEKIVNGKCFICHRIEGETSSQAFSRLEGQHALYIENQRRALTRLERSDEGGVRRVVATGLRNAGLKSVALQSAASSRPFAGRVAPQRSAAAGYFEAPAASTSTALCTAR